MAAEEKIITVFKFASRTVAAAVFLYGLWGLTGWLDGTAAVGLVLATQSPSLKCAAGGFTDMTRIALSDPYLWQQICASNSRRIVQALTRYEKELHGLRTLLTQGKSTALLKKLQTAQKKRQKLRNGQ